MMFDNLINLDIRSISLLSILIAISSNYIGNTLNCETRKSYDSGYTKYIILFIIINYTIKYNVEVVHPFKHVFYSSILFLIFLISQKFEHTYYLVT